jgi:MHS family proline/betaine transporter-like MFS transporter
MKSISPKIILTCMIAGCLEIYDFTLFGTLAPVIAKNYLQFADAKTSLIISYGVFAIGFLFRPIGALIFGYIGDKFGRKASLVTSITIMGISSLIFAMLPTYESIGIISCYIILLTRIMQGISVGGEYSGSIIFAVEHTDPKYRGLAGSLVAAGCMSGVLLATIVSNICTMESMPSWGWRVAFLLGFIIALIGFFIRIRLNETPEFIKVKNIARSTSVPLLKGLRNSWPKFIATILLAATTGINLYIIVIYLPNYIKTLNLESSLIKWLPTIATFVMALLHPLLGYLSDHMGRKRLLVTGSLMLASLAFPLIAVIHNGQVSLILGILILYTFIAVIYMGGMNTFAVEIFKPEERYSLSAFAYSLGMGVLGGSAPMIAASITEYTNNNWYLGLYLFIGSLLGTVGILIIKYVSKE